MSTHAGVEGTVKIGDVTVAEVKSFSLEETADALETSSIGTVARTYRSSLTGWTGSLDVFWDESDVAGQGALSIGAEIVISVYPEGEDVGDTFYTGTCIVTSSSRAASFDSMVEGSVSVQGTGPLTATTV